MQIHSCRNNFLAALKKYDMSARDIHANINWFMNVPVHPDGPAEIEEGLSEPGDYVDLRADVSLKIEGFAMTRIALACRN
jgi:uncharacterized protein YcgI (DUF1989 family)